MKILIADDHDLLRDVLRSYLEAEGGFDLHFVSDANAAIDLMKAEGLAAVAARESAFEDYNADMREAIKSTVWFTGGCKSKEAETA